MFARSQHFRLLVTSAYSSASKGVLTVVFSNRRYRATYKGSSGYSSFTYVHPSRLQSIMVEMVQRVFLFQVLLLVVSLLIVGQRCEEENRYPVHPGLKDYHKQR